MSVAIAGTTRRRPTRRDLAILALATLAHVAVLVALVLDARWTPVMVEPPIIQAELIRPEIARAPSSSPPERKNPARRIDRPSALIASPSPLAPSGPAASTGVVAPPGFTARKLAQESDQARESLRGSLGCRHEKVVALNRDQKNACAEADGQRARTAPMYAAIDPDKKAAFDGDCAKDDAWCLYRVGKGPYPGLFALGKKKKRKGWDD
jgi:hypothetical protein